MELYIHVKTFGQWTHAKWNNIKKRWMQVNHGSVWTPVSCTWSCGATRTNQRTRYLEFHIMNNNQNIDRYFNRGSCGYLLVGERYVSAPHHIVGLKFVCRRRRTHWTNCWKVLFFLLFVKIIYLQIKQMFCVLHRKTNVILSTSHLHKH